MAMEVFDLTSEANRIHPPGAGATVTQPFGFSGQFIQMSKDGSLESFLVHLEAYSALDKKLRRVEEELRSCNLPGWLSRFERRCRRKEQDLECELRARIGRLEAKRSELRGQAEKIGNGLRERAPWLPDTAETLSSLLQFMGRLKGRKRRPNRDVDARDAVIYDYADRSHQEICKLLDAELPLTEKERPAQGLPDSWVWKYGVKSYTQAYKDAGCRKLVHRLISGVLSRMRVP